MTWPAFLATLLLLAYQLCCVYGNSIQLLQRGDIRGDKVQRTTRRSAMAAVEERIERRQSSTDTNSTSWDAMTTTACMSSLSMLNGVASNPAGMAVCYNLPFLDNSTGVFQADLRLYQVMAPIGDFAGIPSQDVQVGLQYVGAQVQMIPTSNLPAMMASKRSETKTEKRATMTPLLLHAYAFVGQINKDLMFSNMNASSLEALLVPIVTLNASTTAGKSIITTLSSDEATFVSGIFSDTANATSAAAASASASAAASAIAAAAPFQMPGTKIAIFPVGAIITGVWTMLLVGTIAYGTIGRMKFRELYRRRQARAEKKGLYGI